MHITNKASFTRHRFSNKEHRFIVVFNVCSHGESENNHKSANGLQSEAFQKCIENGLQLNVKNMKTLLVNANGQVTIAFSWRFRGIYTNSVKYKKYYNSNNLPRPHIVAFGLGVRLACAILQFIATKTLMKTEDNAQCY